mgnify:CR=1 FL=1
MAYAAATTELDRGVRNGDQSSLKMDAVKIVKGSLVCGDATAGYVTSAAPTASRPFVGVALETVYNSAGSAGDKSILVGHVGVFPLKNTVDTHNQALLLKEMYWDDSADSDSQTVASSDQGVGAKVGRVIAQDATHVWVRITGYAMVVDGQAN